MAGSGPAPKPADQRRRRNAKPVMERLPAEGRKGRAPTWPLPPEVRIASALSAAESQRELLEAQVESGSGPNNGPARLAKIDQRIAELTAQIKAAADIEKKLWADVWKTPQAVAWERLGYLREVAQYVRWKALGELGNLEASKEARQLSDRLGLTPLAMLRLQWEIAVDEVAEARGEQDKAKSRRRRLHAVDTG